MPRVSGAADPKSAVLEAAESLFAERGFGAVALREIAREAKVNVGSVTYHFGDKLGLLEAIYDRHTKPMNARRLELIGEAKRIGDPDQRLAGQLVGEAVPGAGVGLDVGRDVLVVEDLLQLGRRTTSQWVATAVAGHDRARTVEGLAEIARQRRAVERR